MYWLGEGMRLYLEAGVQPKYPGVGAYCELWSDVFRSYKVWKSLPLQYELVVIVLASKL